MKDKFRIKFEGALNFRDVGGFTTKSGKKMKTGIIYRSDDLSQLTNKDLIKLSKLKLKSIFDFRTPNEYEPKPDRIPKNKGIKKIHIPFYHFEKDFTGLEKFFYLLIKLRKINFEETVREFYQKLAFERNAQIKNFFEMISDNKNFPILIHCTGGKDRTGFLSAVIQLLAGVPRQEVMDSYMVSNKFIKPRLDKHIKYLRWMSLFQVSAEKMKPMFEVRREYLEEILDDIYKTFGTIEEYLIKNCGIPQNSIINLQRMLTK